MKKFAAAVAALLLLAAVGCSGASAKLTFFCDGEILSVCYASEGALVEPERLAKAPQKDSDEEYDYEFTGWSLSEGGEVVKSLRIEGDTSFYAVFERKSHSSEELFTVIFAEEWEGVRTVLSTQKVHRGELAQPPEELPVHEGHSFSGWEGDVTAPITGRTEFLAIYTRNRYPLMRSVAGKTQEEEVLFEEPLSLAAPALPSGLTFDGWYTDPSFETPAEGKMPARALTLFAKIGVDFSAASLKTGEFVYGGENRVCVEGLPALEGLYYSIVWKVNGREERGESVLLSQAGEYEIEAQIAASYGSARDETTLTANTAVARKQLTAQIVLSPSVVYGEDPAPALDTEGLVLGDVLPAPTFEYRSEGEPSEPALGRLPAGSYTVSAVLPALANYEMGAIAPCPLTVQKRRLTFSAEAEDIVYGEEPMPALTFEGFASGEDASALTVTSPAVEYERDGAPYSSERLSAGEYTVKPRVFAVVSKNYEIVMGQGDAFSVKKAPLTLTVEPEKEEYVYGETPSAHIRHSEFAYADETIESVLPDLEIEYAGKGRLFSAGEYTAEARFTQPDNYTVEKKSAAFTILPKEANITISPVTVLFGEEPSLPEPVISGLLPRDEGFQSEIVSLIEYEFEKERPAGSYPISLRLKEPERFSDYTFTCTGSTLTVLRRTLNISSGEVSQNRNRQWSYTPVLTSGSELFSIEGKLVLKTRNAGVYKAEDIEGTPYFWEIPLKITDRAGKEVTENFDVVYALNVTLNTSRFNITVPTEGLVFVYDNSPHVFSVEVTLDEDETEQLSPELHYSVNGGTAGSEPPALKDAGDYDIRCDISAENYETETRSFHVCIQRAHYTLSGTQEPLRETYDGERHGQELTVSGVVGEDVSGFLGISVLYTPTIGKAQSVSFSEIVNAGTYEISYSVTGNPNYEDIPMRSYTITLSRAQYTVEVERDQRYVYAPAVSFGTGVTVAEGAPVTYTYELDGAHSSSAAPTFRRAVAVTVAYSVPESVNYEPCSGSYRITVEKAKGILNTAGIRRSYVYTGSLQTVDGGATSNNLEDGKITYEHNTFTTVAEGNALAVTVKLEEGANYTAAQETVTGFTVAKKTLTALPVSPPEIGEQCNRLGKTLSEVPLPAHFSWQEGNLPLSLGEHAYGARYNEDPENCNDFALTILFPTRKERLTLTCVGGEAAFGEEAAFADFLLTGEDGTPRTEERDDIEFHADGAKVDLKTGGIYPVECSFSVNENNYFEAALSGERIVPFKYKTVELSGELYTAEDALARLDGGMAIVRHNTAFSSWEGEKSYTIPSGGTLLVPYGEEDTGNTEQHRKQAHEAVSGEGYAALVLPENSQLKVEGKLIVGGLRSSDGQRTSMIVGEHYGVFELCSGACVTVGEGGVFESMGFTYGEGEVHVLRGGSVYEPFAMVGWKGGSISAAIRNEVFPLNQYTLSSLICKTVFEAGSHYHVRASVSATLSLIGGEKNLDLAVSFLGEGEDSFLQLTEGTVEKRVNEENGRVEFKLSGSISFRNMSLKLSDLIQFNTQNLQVPIPGNFSIELMSGARAEVPDGVALKLLPGAQVRVLRGAELQILSGGKIFGYGDGVTFDGVEKFCDGGNKLAYPHAYLSAAYRIGVKDFGYNAETPARLHAEGTLTVASGGTLAADATGNVTLEEGAVTGGSLKEDLTPAITSSTGKMQALMGKGGVFYTAHFPARED